MPEYNNDMRGVLFKNDRKERDNQPDYTGNCEIDRVEMWMSAWIKESKNGRKFMSFSFKKKEDQGHDQREPGNSEQYNQGGDNGDIPF